MFWIWFQTRTYKKRTLLLSKRFPAVCNWGALFDLMETKNYQNNTKNSNDVDEISWKYLSVQFLIRCCYIKPTLIAHVCFHGRREAINFDNGYCLQFRSLLHGQKRFFLRGQSWRCWYACLSHPKFTIPDRKLIF